MTSRQTTLLRTLLAATAAVSGVVLVAFIRPVNSPLNVEGIFALSILLLALLPRKAAVLERSFDAPTWSLAVIVAGAMLAFLPTIRTPLLHDAYVHVWAARTQSWHDFLNASLVRPRPGDLFFRPLGYLSYWLDYKWAGAAPVLWNTWSVALHLINATLVWKLARKLGCGAWGAAVAAMIFAIHGTRPEAVAWVGARFDLMATFFVLAALLAIIRYVERGEIRWCVIGCLLGLCGFLSKESAYSLFLLVLLLIPFLRTDRRPRIIKSAVAVLIANVIALAFRTAFLHGIGGYSTEAGAPAVFQWSAVRTIKALFFRQWAILFFPLNWTNRGTVLKLALIIGIGTAIALVLYTKANRGVLAATLLWVIAAVLPAQHLLLIGADLSGSRVLYLPVVGFALFWGFLSEHSSAPRILVLGFVAFQLVALEHNLAIWREVAELSQKACTDIGTDLTRNPGNVIVSELPNSFHGVYFLRNGFPQCVAITSGQSIDRITVAEDTREHDPNARVYKWDSATKMFEPIR